MPMYKLALVFTCLACVGQGLRALIKIDQVSENEASEAKQGFRSHAEVQKSSERVQPAPSKRSARGGALLAALLAAASPAAPFRAPGVESPSLATGNAALSHPAITPHGRGAPIRLGVKDRKGDCPVALLGFAVAQLRELKRLEDENIPYQNWLKDENIPEDMLVRLMQDDAYIVLQARNLLELKRDAQVTIQALNKYAAKLNATGAIEALRGHLSPQAWKNLPFRKLVEDGAKVLVSAMPFALALASPDPAVAAEDVANLWHSSLSGIAPYLVDATREEFSGIAPYLADILGLSVPAVFLITTYIGWTSLEDFIFREPDPDSIGNTRFPGFDPFEDE